MVNLDCLEYIKTLDSESVDIILTDPPYLYLVNQVLDRKFDENTLFSNFYRILKKNGKLVFFGRGDSFYRWNLSLIELGFHLKVEMVWDKISASSPITPIGRVHENISFHSKDVNTMFINYKSEEKSKKQLLKKYSDIKMIENEKLSKVIIQINDLQDDKIYDDILSYTRDKKCIHPTQKPVKLLSRLLKMAGATTNSIVFDPFMGSCSTGIACKEIGASFIGCEIHKPYYDAAVKRFNETKFDLKLF